ncbi:MAG: polymer-forming cytoskeletal protein, partial [Thermoguttaceae bacterium]|nr:polymer-forming cytoskeletal protein [Thermoguttaceae bacterium]
GLCATGVSRVYDCVFVGCRATQYGGGINVARDAVVNGVTVAGCVAATGGGAMRVASGTCVVENSILAGSIAGAYNSTATGSVVDVASSQVGFVAPPPDDLTSETWDANAWQNWDLRLLDDASANPSPYRDSGDVDSMSQYDYQGNFRGRETGGAASCSPGAYETIQADLFWVGRDATGAEVVAPSWNASSGWAASRFATASGDKAPQSSDAVFVDGAPTFDVSSFRVSRLVVGGGTSLGVKNNGASTLSLVAGVFDFGYGSTVRNAAGTSRLQIQGSAASRFGDYVYFPQQFYFGDADALQIAPTAKFTTVVSAVKLYANGTYNNYNLQITNVATVENGSTGCNNIYVNFQKPTARIAATGSPRAVCNTVKWTTPTGATDDFAGLTEGSTPIVFAPKKSATVAGAGSANDFIVDISQTPVSQTLALTLTGQKIYGSTYYSDGAAFVGLTGRAKVGSFLQVETLKVSDAATLIGGDGDASLGRLSLSAGATLTVVALNLAAIISLPEGAVLTVDGGIVSASPLTLENGARVVIVDAEKDAVFSASGGDVTAQDATINGDGLSTSSLSISSGAALTVDGGNVDVTGTLTVNADSILTVVGAKVSAAKLSVYAGATLAIN